MADRETERLFTEAQRILTTVAAQVQDLRQRHRSLLSCLQAICLHRRTFAFADRRCCELCGLESAAILQAVEPYMTHQDEARYESLRAGVRLRLGISLV